MYARVGDFYGRAVKSPNKKYLLAWNDSDGKGVGGFRESGNGCYLLAENGSALLIRRDIQRPMQGVVADNGNFMLVDELFGMNTKSVLYVFSKGGRCLLKHEFGANMMEASLSDDGATAKFWCANSDTDDCGVSGFINVATGEVVRDVSKMRKK